MIADPPVLDGVLQERLICEDDIVVAERFVGDDGTTLKVVADAVLDGELVTNRFTVDTLYVYVVLCTSPLSEYVVAVLPVLATIVDQLEPPLVDLSIL